MIILKKGREAPLKKGHPWIFSGAISNVDGEDGDILPVQSAQGEHLGYGFYQGKSSLALRMITFDKREPLLVIEEKLKRALLIRQSLFDNERTTGYRLVNAEGDGLSGLIIDRYKDTLVIQIGTIGFEKLKFWLVEKLHSLMPLACIYEKSDSSSRKQEGLSPSHKILYGNLLDPIEIMEEGLKFKVFVQEGQKTGFFLDQREMRKKIMALSLGKSVLNAFSYTGAFTVYAMKGGAKFVDSVDVSKQAIEWSRENCRINGINLSDAHFISIDAFRYLEKVDKKYNLIILDPPAFAKKEKDKEAAFRAYRELNYLAMQRLKKNGILLTSSCSYYMDEALFTRSVQEAALRSGKDASIIGRHILAEDHPISLTHPEGSYLKSLLVSVNKNS